MLTEPVPLVEAWDPGGGDTTGEEPFVRTDYADFIRVLRLAYEQTAEGKGAERHGGAIPFDQQPIMTEVIQADSIAGLTFQARKKILESLRLPPERQRAELLGAIVYTVAAYLGSELLERKE